MNSNIDKSATPTEEDPRIAAGLALIVFCTGYDGWRFSTKRDDPFLYEYWNDTRDESAALVIGEKHWYLDLQAVEGGCIARLAHGQFGTSHRALRGDCVHWPTDPFWKPCCESASLPRGSDGGGR